MAANRTARLVFILGAMLLLAPMALSSTARASVFTDVQGAVADALDTDNETGGYAVGILAVVVVLFLTGLLLAGFERVGAGGMENILMGFAALAGIAFVVLVKWWPPWTAIFMAFGFILMILGRKGGESS